METITNTIFKTESGEIYKAYEVDYNKKTISGYRIFVEYGQPNPYRTFDLKSVKIETIN